MKTECNNCKNRKSCKKEDYGLNNYFLCKKYETDFTLKREILEVEGNFSERFLSMKEERDLSRFDTGSSFQDYLKNGGAWDFSQKPSRRLFKC
jgi:hypothetical protein